ncbi:Glucose-6-phosphatase 3 [Oryzias melastigma]|uniref:Glucose-6-phosphatase n=1 Tax=Oryzias melastigma TaxID=30732 RepID=A0A834FD75_ORYME|nr:glucose-6-phosphatase 3 [Oryzias melastigma]KAF6730006.1 Glucose-6-phosphatase 3 [Oryzias melastigma]
METVYTHGIRVAETLQEQTSHLEKFWLTVTLLGDPKAAFLLVFPFTYFISKRTGVAVVWVAAISEWLNLVFKWILFGERPFWWIGESGLYDKTSQPKVHQFPSTCETGPGSPSGHAMVTAAVWWVVVSSLGSFVYSRTHSLVISAVPYMLYVTVLAAVGISRIFILAHFPHQVIAGCLTGLLLGVTLRSTVPEGRPLLFFFSFSVGLMFSALVLNVALQQLGVDIFWSISLAKKWCSRGEWIRLDTAPFSSLTRDCGALVGLGLAQYWKPGGWSLPWAARALSLAVSSMGLYHVNRLPLPVKPQSLFYSLFFVKFVLVPQIVMVFVPGLVHLLTRKKKKD